MAGGICAAIPACAGICRRVAADDFALCKRFSGQDVFVVRYFGTVCGYCRLACEVGAMISGSGIPQLEGEMIGKLNQRWYRVLPAKFLGGFLSLFAGLSLGREGPSIQLGAMTGKGISKMLDRGKTEEKFLLTCGASAGLSAAFHAPLAGVMFSL